MTKKTIDFAQFENVSLIVGTIIQAEEFPQARKPAYKLLIDLGPEIGIKKSSAQITTLYSTTDLIGKQVLCVTNFAPRQIGPFMSEVLTTGFTDENGNIVLAQPERNVPNGSKLH